MNRAVLIAVIFALISVNIQAEEISTHVNISWNPNSAEKLSDVLSVELLSFQGAVYDENQLPRSVYKLRVSDDFEIGQASVTDFVWETLPGRSDFIGADYVSENADFAYGVYAEKKTKYLWISVLPVRNYNGKFERATSFNIHIVKKLRPVIAANKSRSYASNSVLSSGTFYKLKIVADGFHKITYTDLVSAGIDPSGINPQKFKIYSNGGGMLPEPNSVFRHDDLVENPIYVHGESDGTFSSGDYLLFYAQCPDRWAYNATTGRYSHIKNLYSTSSGYFLQTDGSTGKRISGISSTSDSPTHTVSTFVDYAFFDHDSINLIKSGREWYAEAYEVLTSYQHNFSFPDIVTSEKAYLKARTIARSPNNNLTNYFTVSAAGNSVQIGIGSINFSYNTEYAKAGAGEMEFYPSSASIPVTVTYSLPTTTSTGWLDYIELNVHRNLTVPPADQLIFRNPVSAGIGNITEFIVSGASSSTLIWDVTDPTDAMQVNGSLNGSQISFRLHTDTIREFAAANPDYAYRPIISGQVSNQNLHSLGSTDMVIVTKDLFRQEADRLAQFHRDFDGYSVAVVSPQQVYNEFSSGNQDPTAIRLLLKMLYDRATTPEEQPDYLLLFGDGSYDNLNRISPNTNLIPTFQSANSLSPTSSFATDDYFGVLDDDEGNGSNGLLDIGVGRFPVQTLEEAQAMVDKVIRYCTKSSSSNSYTSCASTSQCGTLGDWKNIICFVADDEDNNLHFSQSDQIAEYVDTTYDNFNIDKIYFDAYPQITTPAGQRYPDVQEAITRRMERGVFLFNYTGHGGETGFAHERVLTVQDINAWENECKMPIFMTATCEFSRYDDPARTSGGEYAILNPNGGPVALFSTTRLVYSSSNFELNKKFSSFVFKDTINGKTPAMGDVIRYAKNAASGASSTNNRNFTLLGDPGLRLAFPEYDVFTSTINGTPASSFDTVNALSKVTVTGYLVDKNGQKLNEFNGIIFPTVYDKAATITTLGNDPPPASYKTTFKLQKNIIYKGKASVINGDFTFSFIVPKDIAYKFGAGRISYYAENGFDDANGYCENIIIGGTSTNISEDTEGPAIELFMNTEEFVFGGVTDESPVLIARLSDFNGINTVGNGIGHDLVAVLDGNTESSIVLNDYYEADLNSYENGTVRYQLKDLSEGRHFLSLKAWDTYNNSSISYIEFVVSAGSGLKLEHVYNYPNPFSTHTSFLFEHNQPCCSMDITITIYSMTGKLVKTIQQTIEAEGYRIDTDEIVWDGLDDFGNKIGKGVYIYKLFVRSDNATSAEKMQKLVILN
ncbi:MAG: type IX secretion system sortase PorU [Bacteroidetes bacterium]|nr:type IX secretion system sortase PorU [Bacteroidota bacterium]MBU1720562.1 type IX secretion system sortase PorU [Bacteroidota bacterium]